MSIRLFKTGKQINDSSDFGFAKAAGSSESHVKSLGRGQHESRGLAGLFLRQATEGGGGGVQV